MTFQRFSLTFVLSLLSAGLFTGCASVPTRVAGDPIGARTFSFVDAGRNNNPAYQPAGPNPIHPVIQEALTRSLAAKGLTRVASGGEVTVAYLVIVGNNAGTTALDEYYGFGPDQAALRTKAHKAYTGQASPNYFEAGTLLVDIVETRTAKLLHRNFVSRPVLREATSEVRANRITEAVEEVLAGVRVNR
jgi:hypothetical protein